LKLLSHNRLRKLQWARLDWKGRENWEKKKERKDARLKAVLVVPGERSLWWQIVRECLGTRFNPLLFLMWLFRKFPENLKFFFLLKFNMVCTFWIVLMCWCQQWFLKNKKTSLACILTRKVIWKAVAITLPNKLLDKNKKIPWNDWFLFNGPYNWPITGSGRVSKCVWPSPSPEHFSW